MMILEIRNRSKRPNKKLIAAWSGTAKQLRQILKLKKK